MLNEEMVSEDARLRTFFHASQRKDWPDPELLAAAGFYFGGYNGRPDDIICFCCGLSLTTWNGSDDDPMEVHR